MEFSNSILFNFSVILFLVGLNAFFVATEFALVSIRRSRVQELLSQGKTGAKYVDRAIHNLDQYIAGTQVGITLASLALGWLGEPVVAQTVQNLIHHFPSLSVSPNVLHGASFGVAFLTITMLHVVLGELVPKSLALQQPEKVSLAVSWPMSGIIILLRPLIWSLNGIGNFILRLLGIDRAGEHENVHSVEELEIIVNQSREAGMLDETETDVMQRSFRFSELTAKDVMVRRIDIVALDLEKPCDVLLDEAAATIHSRLPVFTDSLDKISGILFVHDVFRAYRRGAVPANLQELCRPVFVVPEGIHLDHLLEFFREQHTQIAIVVDEYGGTAGLVTFEDVVEEVTGPVEDELEAEEPSIKKLEDGRILLRGDVRLDEIQSELGWDLKEDTVHVDTIAGLVMNRLGRVARVDDTVQTPVGVLKVVEMARMRIMKVSLDPKVFEPIAHLE
ncbi:MAG: hemolysin family protein [Bdellovibrionota bacterium]